MIDEVLNKAAAVELFEKEAILLGTNDVVPFYRAVELFGEEAVIFLDRNMECEYLKFGNDYSAWGRALLSVLLQIIFISLDF